MYCFEAQHARPEDGQGFSGGLDVHPFQLGFAPGLEGLLSFNQRQRHWVSIKRSFRRIAIEGHGLWLLYDD